MITDLQLLGLTKNEAIVYDLLVKHGPCRAGVLIAKADIHRNLVYRALESLVDNGYATKVTEKGVWKFQITDPHVLLTNVKRKEDVFTAVLKEIERYRVNITQRIAVYEGVESYRTYWLESLKKFPLETVDCVAGGELTAWTKLMGPRALEEYYALAKKKKLSWKTIYFKKNSVELELLKQSPVPFEARIIYSEKQPDLLGSNFNVVNDTIIIHSTVGTPRVLEIRDAPIFQLFQTYFSVLWEKAEPYMGSK